MSNLINNKYQSKENLILIFRTESQKHFRIFSLKILYDKTQHNNNNMYNINIIKLYKFNEKNSINLTFFLNF